MVHSDHTSWILTNEEPLLEPPLGLYSKHSAPPPHKLSPSTGRAGPDRGQQTSCEGQRQQGFYASQRPSPRVPRVQLPLV